MPFIEYKCEDCHRKYEKYYNSQSQVLTEITCECGKKAHKIMSLIGGVKCGHLMSVTVGRAT